MTNPFTYRDEVTPADAQHVRQLVESTGVFNRVEEECAVELVEERLARGPASGYHFVFAEQDGQVAGYACYGLIALTVGSYDLYWIAVRRTAQGQGLGRLLMEEVQRRVRSAGGRRIYIETSTRPPYAPTRGFYQRCGCRLEVVLEDFYAAGDGKAIYVLVL
ncbi:MAG: GNAT family N-acetyltransferase [Thermoguttaceae bacterium]|jgi:GNAT superfamily N-acetyltransferase